MTTEWRRVLPPGRPAHAVPGRAPDETMLGDEGDPEGRPAPPLPRVCVRVIQTCSPFPGCNVVHFLKARLLFFSHINTVLYIKTIIVLREFIIGLLLTSVACGCRRARYDVRPPRRARGKPAAAIGSRADAPSGGGGTKAGEEEGGGPLLPLRSLRASPRRHPSVYLCACVLCHEPHVHSNVSSFIHHTHHHVVFVGL